MKTLITLIFVLFVGFTAQAQNPDALVKVKTNITNIIVPVTSQEIIVKNENGVSVIYIYKNYRIKKALSFTAINNKAKLA